MIEFLKSLKDVAPAIGTIIAALSALVAFAAFYYTRRMNRRRATLDMVLKTFVDEDGRKRYAEFKGVMQRHNDPKDSLNIIEFADPSSPPTPERQIIRGQINEYELISLGIRRKIFDEKIYKMWFQDQFQRDFVSLEAFIDEVRGKRPSVFCEYVWLYNRWSKSPHPENAPTRFKLMWWGFTKNEAKLKAFTKCAE